MKVCVFPYISLSPERLQPASGYSTYFLGLSRALIYEGVDVHLLVLSPSSTFHRELSGITIHPLKMPKLFFLDNLTMNNVLSHKYVASYLKKLDDTYNFHVFHTTVAWNYFLKWKPCVVTTGGIHPSLTDVIVQYWRRYRGPKKLAIPLNLVIKQMERASFKRAQKIITYWQCKARTLGSMFGFEKTVYIPYGIDKEPPTPMALSKRYTALKRDVLANKRILYVSVDLTRQRTGVYQLLKALAKVKEEASFQLLLVGQNGEKLEPELSRLGIRGNVIDFGTLSSGELSDLYSTADIFVLPGLVDDCPYVVLEAMVHGLPVIGSLLPTFEERIIHGRNGLLVPVGDVDSLAEAIHKIFRKRDLLRAMGLESEKIVEERFSWKTVAQKIISLYDDILEMKNE